MTRDANTTLAAVLADEWVRAGVTDVAVAPGSRNAPLTLALTAEPRLRLHVRVDERSAGFFALGCARASGRPAVVCCTSGTAAAHLHPAVLEARHGQVPLMVCTADRPPELRDTGAGQTINQVGLYGDAPRWFCDVDAPAQRADAGRWWRALASRAAAAAVGPPAGPVHLNLAFRDPLAPTGRPLLDAPPRAAGEPWTAIVPARRVVDDPTLSRLTAGIAACRRGILVAGWGTEVALPVVERFAARARWPVLADPLSGLRAGPHAVSTYDALLRAPGFAAANRPDLVLRLGAAPTSAAATRWIASAPEQWLVDPDARWLDPSHSVTRRIEADATPLLEGLGHLLGDVPGDTTWPDGWREADRRARRAIDAELDGSEEPFEGRVARDVVAALPPQSSLIVASSMPVRDVESFAGARSGVRVLANRGVNGIDGLVSTTLGVAAVSPGPTVALTGDLSFLHDANGLLGAGGLHATFVVVDNDGGGIFSFLPYAQTVTAEAFETVLATPPGVDVAEVARAHGVSVTEVEKASELGPALDRAVEGPGLQLLRVRTDRATNVARHDAVWSAVADALDEELSAPTA